MVEDIVIEGIFIAFILLCIIKDWLIFMDSSDVRWRMGDLKEQKEAWISHLENESRERKRKKKNLLRYSDSQKN